MPLKSKLKFLVALAATSPNIVYGKNDRTAPVHPLCAALLQGTELARPPRPRDVQDLARATRGKRAAVVLVRGLGQAPDGGASEPGVSYVVPWREDAVGDGFAVLAGSRRGLLAEARRLARGEDARSVSLTVLMSQPAHLHVPSTVTHPQGSHGLYMAELVFNRANAPDVAFYDAGTGDIFYPVAADVLDAMEDDDWLRAGIVPGTATGFADWHAHELRRRLPNHLIRLPGYAMLSHAAFRALRRELASPGEVDPAPSSFQLASVLRETLRMNGVPATAPTVDASAATPAPPARAPARFPILRRPRAGARYAPPLPHFVEIDLPSLEDLWRYVAQVPAEPDHVTRALLRLTYAPDANFRTLLDQDDSVKNIYARIWTHYFPKDTPVETMRLRDGRKLLQTSGEIEHPRKRLMRAWRELRERVKLAATRGF